jgi:hypothetical protein
MAQTRKAPPAKVPARPKLVKRQGKRGRPAGPSPRTTERLAVLDKLLAPVVSGKVASVDLFPADIGQPDTYTGLQAFVGRWAKLRGHAVSAPAAENVPGAVVVERK